MTTELLYPIANRPCGCVYYATVTVDVCSRKLGTQYHGFCETSFGGWPEIIELTNNHQEGCDR